MGGVIQMHIIDGNAVTDYSKQDIKHHMNCKETFKEKLEYLQERELVYKHILKNDEKLNFVLELKEKLIESQELIQKYQTENAESVKEPEKAKTYNLKWNDLYSHNDFLELCKALIESKAILGKQKDFINAFSNMLNIEINNPDQSLQSIKNSRNADKETKFLDTLQSSLKDWINKEK